jgi:signal transduction histidine kinase
LKPNQNQLHIEFVAPNFASSEALNYQYILEGADREWIMASEQRSVNYANIAPGSYRFLVRARNSAGVASAPALVTFQVLPPVWRRWGFQLLIATAIMTAAYAIHRWRLVRLLEVERVRARIATDLHDDIGASLSQIAILTEVAGGDDAKTNAEPLARIGSIAREVVESMSDIVLGREPA